MAKEILLSDGRTAMFDDDATEEEITKKLQQAGLTRSVDAANMAQPAAQPTAPSRMDQFVQAMKPEAGGAAGLSLINSLGFGLPEMAARALGGGPAINQLRQEYPMATTAGDIAGLSNLGALAAKTVGRGASMLGEKMLQRATSETGQEATMAALRNQATLPQQAGRFLVRPALQAGGGMVGAQVGAGMLGQARTPENPMAGFQQGAQTFRNVATELPGTQLIPGLQSTIGAVTSGVPALAGYGDLAYQYATIEDRIRKEAARKALQGQ